MCRHIFGLSLFLFIFIVFNIFYLSLLTLPSLVQTKYMLHWSGCSYTPIALLLQSKSCKYYNNYRKYCKYRLVAAVKVLQISRCLKVEILMNIILQWEAETSFRLKLEVSLKPLDSPQQSTTKSQKSGRNQYGSS